MEPQLLEASRTAAKGIGETSSQPLDVGHELPIVGPA